MRGIMCAHCGKSSGPRIGTAKVGSNGSQGYPVLRFMGAARTIGLKVGDMVRWEIVDGTLVVTPLSGDGDGHDSAKATRVE